jgi:hypothetical protein
VETLRETTRRPGVQIDVKFVEPLPLIGVTSAKAGAAAPKPAGRRGKFCRFTAIGDCTRPQILKIYAKLNACLRSRSPVPPW